MVYHGEFAIYIDGFVLKSVVMVYYISKQSPLRTLFLVDL